MMRYLRKNVKSIMMIIVVLFVVSCFAGYGMYSGGGNAGAGGGEGIADYDVATVGGERIKRSRLETEMFQMIRNLGPQGETISEDDYPSLRTAVLDQIAIASEMDKEVKARNITVTDDEIDNAIKEIESSFPTKELYFQEMEREGLTEAKLKETIRTQFARQKLFEQVTSPVSADESELRSFYDMMKAYYFQKPEGFKVN
ncbi:MAG: SurA N-terminal domain-containing protein, partial [Synergistaceae bacterium]|nr:SurA N-terminal domain-containing protein [Synergistaceae bacterium]